MINMAVAKKKNKPVAKWEKDFLSVIKKQGSQDAKEILSELETLLQETSQTTPSEESSAEELKTEQLKRAKELETRIQYTEEQKELTKLEPSIKEIDKKIKDVKELIQKIPENEEDEAYRKQQEQKLDELKKELEPLEKQAEPLEEIIGGLNRKLKTITNRLERSVFSGFGSIIRNRRKELGLSLKQIEDKTGISPSYINRIEKGQRKAPSYRIIEQLAEALDMPVGKLINVAEVDVQDEVPSLEEMILSSQFTVNGKRASKHSKEKIVEFIQKLNEAQWEEKKYEEFIKFMGYFDYFKETFSSKKKK